MKYILLFLFIILIIEIILLALFFWQFLYAYAYKDFMNTLNSKLNTTNYNYYEEYIKLFGSYNEYYGLESLFVTIPIIIVVCALIFSILLQTCPRCLKITRAVISLLLISLCFYIMIYLTVISFLIKNKVNLTNQEIYIFDDEFNKEVKNNLKKMYYRKIYMILFSIFVSIGSLIQFILIVLDIKLTYQMKGLNINKNNNDIKEEEITVQQENKKQNNNLNKKDNKDNSSNQIPLKLNYDGFILNKTIK